MKIMRIVATGTIFIFAVTKNEWMFGHTLPIYRKHLIMKFANDRLHIRITAALLTKAHETARQGNVTLSRVVRDYLEAYIASQPTKKAE